MNKLEAIKARAQAATPGPWYPKATDDALCMNARYVSLDEGDGFCHDNEIFMAEPTSHERVVAVTLLQYPRLACLADYKWDENTEFIAHARADIPLLLAVAEAAADIVRVMTPIEHPKSPTDYAYGKVTNEQWRALVATIAPLLEEAE